MLPRCLANRLAASKNDSTSSKAERASLNDTVGEGAGASTFTMLGAKEMPVILVGDAGEVELGEGKRASAMTD